jgi:hypothetical protein
VTANFNMQPTKFLYVNLVSIFLNANSNLVQRCRRQVNISCCNVRRHGSAASKLSLTNITHSTSHNMSTSPVRLRLRLIMINLMAAPHTSNIRAFPMNADAVLHAYDKVNSQSVEHSVPTDASSTNFEFSCSPMGQSASFHTQKQTSASRASSRRPDGQGGRKRCQFAEVAHQFESWMNCSHT